MHAFKNALTTMGEKFSEDDIEKMWKELGLGENDDLPVELFINYCMSN